MFPFIQELDVLASEGHQLIADGKFGKARRIAQKLDRSPYSEGWVHAEKLFARIDIAKGRGTVAKERALVGLNNSWGDPELLKILRIDNPDCNSPCSLYRILLRGGAPSRGPIGFFTPKHRVIFEVVATNEQEAVGYISFVGQIEGNVRPFILKVSTIGTLPQPLDRHGVYAISPFGL